MPLDELYNSERTKAESKTQRAKSIV